MPKPAAAAVGRRRSSRGTKAIAKRPSSAAKAKRADKTAPAVAKVSKRASPKEARAANDRRPTIMPSQSVHHATPPIVLEGVVYPVLGDPVDLDPCSNAMSIVHARRAITLREGEDPLRDGGLAIPWRGTVYVNPPFGETIIEWIKKIIVENRNNGAQVIALLPAHVGSTWFDLVAATARACFIWGPAPGNRRLQFIGNEDKAAFACVLAYWGSDLATFSRYAGRFCHPWYPEHDLRLLRALIGDSRLPDASALSVASADELLALSRNDDIACALASLGSATLGEILDVGNSLLLSRLRQICAYELGAALLYASRTNGKSWLDRRIPRTPSKLDPRQLDLMLANAAAAPGLPDAADPSSPRALDDQIYDEIHRGTLVGDLVSAVGLRTRCACSQGQLRGALSRLRQAKKIDQHGRTQGARYFATNARENEDKDGSRKQKKNRAR